MNLGIVGALVGAAFAVSAILWNVQARRRQQDPTPLASTLGLRRDSVERRIYVLGSSVAFPIYALVVMLYLLLAGAPTTAGILSGSAGLIYGVSSAWAGARLSGC